jgi:hypothetical protein
MQENSFLLTLLSSVLARVAVSEREMLFISSEKLTGNAIRRSPANIYYERRLLKPDLSGPHRTVRYMAIYRAACILNDYLLYSICHTNPLYYTPNRFSPAWS